MNIGGRAILLLISQCQSNLITSANKPKEKRKKTDVLNPSLHIPFGLGRYNEIL